MLRPALDWPQNLGISELQHIVNAVQLKCCSEATLNAIDGLTALVLPLLHGALPNFHFDAGARTEAAGVEARQVKHTGYSGRKAAPSLWTIARRGSRVVQTAARLIGGSRAWKLANSGISRKPALPSYQQQAQIIVNDPQACSSQGQHGVQASASVGGQRRQALGDVTNTQTARGKSGTTSPQRHASKRSKREDKV
jgi:hypothetical protein